MLAAGYLLCIRATGVSLLMGQANRSSARYSAPPALHVSCDGRAGTECDSWYQRSYLSFVMPRDPHYEPQ